VRLFLLGIVALAIAGCTAPGEPPAHPSPADYADLMRRETDKAQSSLATMTMTLRLVQRGDITRNYAVVVSRQAGSDLDGVVTDLRQVSAPSAAQATAQRRLGRLLDAASGRVTSLDADWGDDAAVARLLHDVTKASARAQRLSQALG
jgi:hypothetical protein